MKHIYVHFVYYNRSYINMSACVINSLSCTVHSHRDWLRRKGSVIVAIVLNHKCHKKHVSTIFFFLFFWRVHNAYTVYSVGCFLLFLKCIRLIFETENGLIITMQMLSKLK